MRAPMRPLPLLSVAGEILLGVAAALGLVAALDQIAPVESLGVVPLLVVLALAVRRGQVAALAAAVLSVLGLNFFFIPPVHRLTIADNENVVALAVLLIAAVVVGRLAAQSRARAEEAHARAFVAARREAEAGVLAEAATLLLARGAPVDQLPAIADRIAAAVGARSARLTLDAAPTARAGERALRLPVDGRPVWLYADGGTELERLLEPLARLLDVAFERERVGVRSAEAEAVRRADVAKTAVLHAISHDLRSPLTAIRTAAEALGDGGLEDEDRRELISVVDEESLRLTRLVDDLLDLSRIEAGAVDPRVDWVDLHDVVGRAVRSARATHDGVAVTLELPDELPLVRADAGQLERAISNLVENAMKFSPEGEPVRVRAGVGPGAVTVRVLDRGPGVPQAQRARVFEPFFRGRPRSGGGAGLGLAIAKGFVEANGGRLTLQAGTDEGTAFAVRLPLSTPAAAPPGPAPQEPGTPGPGSVR